MEDKLFIAHRRESDEKSQSVMEHLTETSELSGRFAEKIGLKKSGEVIGLLHDLGKASQKFQNYLLSAEGLINPDNDQYIDPQAQKGKIDHSTAGAQVIYKFLWGADQKKNAAAQILALCLSSHHSGLIDCLKPDGENNFERRMSKPAEETHVKEALSNLPEMSSILDRWQVDDISQEITNKMKGLYEKNDSKETLQFKFGLLIRFLFSCLIDADRLSTADFETPSNVNIRNYGQYVSWKTLIERLNNKIREFDSKEDKNEVDRLRSQVSQACYDFSTKPKGIYQLTVPTGGGKTLASLRFALEHAAKYGLDRIIYVIPYTSIIDQNAEEVRKILEDKDEKGNYLNKIILEHHSNLTPEEETFKQNLLAQDWDAPVIFTTQVQFLETLFGSGTRGARRMHQLANSVIIFDEVQTIPINCIHMLNVAFRFLVHSCGATVVLCTATQPPLDNIANEHRSLIIHSDQHIIPNEKELYEKLKRTKVFDRRKLDGWSDEEVAELAGDQLQEKGSVLIVVNTTKSARSLFQVLAQKNINNLYHLSTHMCPEHRLNILTEIKEKLDKEPVVCVSTQLIEAGVDIDFGTVIRYLAGLDSITQAAGRCNRHGKREGFGNVWVVNPAEENIEPLKSIKIGAEIAQRVLDDYKEAPESFNYTQTGLRAMECYYNYYYHERREEMKYNVGINSPVGRDDDLFNLLSTNTKSLEGFKRANQQIVPNIPFRQSFMSAAKSFHVIDSPTRGVVVPYRAEGKEIIAGLCGAFDLEKDFRLLKRAQRYSVNLFSHEFEKLISLGAIHEVQPQTGIFCLNEQYYSNEFGWSIEIVNKMPFQSV